MTANLKMRGFALLGLLVNVTAVLAITLVPTTNATTQSVSLVDVFPGVTFNYPVDIANAGDGRLFIVERSGLIRFARLDETSTEAITFLDITDRVEASSEKGLLGLVFHTDYANNGAFYVNYTTLIDGQLYTRISRFTVSSNPNAADPASELVLLQLAQPFSNHNGGDLSFGPDGYLYIGLGDGGSGGDPDERAQNVGDLLGKMLRIDVDGGGSAPDCGSGGNYTIPADNPLIGQAGCDEIWALGLRNPWRFSFDRQTGDMFIADVGQNAIEEIDYQPATFGGLNYGWDIKEGTTCHEPASGCDSTGLIDPVYEYGHSNGRCSITGGFVYRGSQYPALQGDYIYADFCTGEVWGLTPNSGDWNGALTNALLADTSLIATFGEDANGELYLATFGSAGSIYRIQENSPAPALSIRKTGPSDVAFGQPISYTLTISNTGTAAATNLVITDILPANASYVSSSDGGALVGDTVTWNVSSLTIQSTNTVQLTIMATETTTNQDYGVVADGGYRALWTRPVVTLVNTNHVLLPIIFKN